MGKFQPKIYFACSIRGGRQDQQIYFEIIQLLKKYGPVLSEHFGDPDLDPNENADVAAHRPASNRAIHDLDMAWIKEADVIVAEVTQPSLGVGYEIGKAEDLGKPVLALFREGDGHNLSAMIAGSTQTGTQTYRQVRELNPIFKEFFGRLSTKS